MSIFTFRKCLLKDVVDFKKRRHPTQTEKCMLFDDTLNTVQKKPLSFFLSVVKRIKMKLKNKWWWWSLFFFVFFFFFFVFFFIFFCAKKQREDTSLLLRERKKKRKRRK